MVIAAEPRSGLSGDKIDTVVALLSAASPPDDVAWTVTVLVTIAPALPVTAS